MKINSELPLCLFEDNNNLNEYDFVLFHLYKYNKKYKEYYLNQRKLHPNRLMILDNSAYEYFIKGEELNLKEYHKVILELKPDMYILPDVLMDIEKTITGVRNFMNSFGKNVGNSKPIAVLQGNKEDELLRCADIYRGWGINNIAIPFHNRFFKNIGFVVGDDISKPFVDRYGNMTSDILYAMGRVSFVKDYGWWLKDNFDYVHMLGSHCPQEKLFYKDFDTMDTSYPVKCAIVGWELGEETEKPDIIIDHFLEEELPEDTKDLIKRNICIFKNI